MSQPHLLSSKVKIIPGTENARATWSNQTIPVIWGGGVKTAWEMVGDVPMTAKSSYQPGAGASR